MPILLRAGVPATFFLTGASLSGTDPFWWERLQDALERGLVDEQEIGSWLGPRAEAASAGGVRPLAAAIAALPAAQREELNRRLRDRVGSDPREDGLRARDVRELVAAGFRIAFHTRRHDALPSLDDKALERAMEEGRSELATAAGNELALIAFPHGEADSRVAAAARAAGYRFGFTVSSQPVNERSDPLLLPRASARRQSLGHFALALARTQIR
jgi:peptidoglycan/xylan/chitin deacetylase (PgdA/CDA1 family)